MNLDLRLFTDLEKIIVEHLESAAAEIVAGKASSYDDYRFRTGRIKGLREALEIARDANRRAIGLDDKDER